MSNFLNNLAARALQRQEAVRPRFASLFEPPAAGSPSLPAGPAEVETILFEQAPDALSTIRPDAPPAPPYTDSRPSPRESHGQPPAPGSPRRGGFADEAEHATRESGAVTPAPPQGREPAEKSRAQLTPAVREGEPPVPVSSAKEIPTRVEVFRHEPPAASAPEVKVRAAESSGGAEERVRGLEGRVTSLEATRAGEGRPEPFSPGPGAVVRVAHRPAPPYTPTAAPPRPAAVGDSEPEDGRPQITVTIGRVDVRAVFPAPPESPRAPAPRAAPKNTLAEYLKQRERGRR